MSLREIRNGQLRLLSAVRVQTRLSSKWMENGPFTYVFFWLVDGPTKHSVMRAAIRAHPSVVFHQITSMAGTGSFKKFDEQSPATNRLETVWTASLLAAAKDAGARSIVAQSYTGWNDGRGEAAERAESESLAQTPTSASR